MIITAITLENFKSIKNPVRIELKPITLLFGANSVGKSSIIQALHYAREIVMGSGPDADKSSIGGDAIRLGGFKNLVNNHDLNKTIRMKFELGLYGIAAIDGAEIYAFVKEQQSDHLNNFTEEIIEQIRELYVEQLNKGNMPWVELRISCTSPSKDIYSIETAVGFGTKEIACSASKSFNIFMKGPNWHWSDETNLLANHPVNHGISLTHFHMLKVDLDDFIYVGPLRKIPPPDFCPATTPIKIKSRWADGLAAWDILHKDDRVRNEASLWFSGKDYFNTGYGIVKKSFVKLDTASDLYTDLIDLSAPQKQASAIEKLTKQPATQMVVLKDMSTGIELSPSDVGVGISQVLPLLPLALSDNAIRIVAVEQPELHIHPAMQLVLGDLFVNGLETEINMTRGKRFLLETHSEHLLLRVLRRIRESREHESCFIFPDELSINFLESSENGLIVTKIRVDEEGEFKDPWPHGFFNERTHELY